MDTFGNFAGNFRGEIRTNLLKILSLAQSPDPEKNEWAAI
jgi:hypothetical protein